MTPEAADQEMSWPVVASSTAFQGAVIGIRRDTLADADGTTFEREVVTHSGAVAVLALDDEERVLVVSQYRHPAGRRLVELPAGILDVAGEDPADAAARELAEEGRLRAGRWSVLLRLMPSPGVSDEVITVYLAQRVTASEVPTGFVARHEESTMTRAWVPLAGLVQAALSGRVTNGPLVAAVLAAWVRRSHDA